MPAIKSRLMSVVTGMRDACDQAERIINDDTRSTFNKAGQVLHTMAWGWANASTGIESARSFAENALEIGAMNRKEVQSEDRR